MTGEFEQAPAGWYDDPHAPDRMRYFDGQAWTNHFHQPGKLPGIGEWFNTTFSAISSYWKGAIVLVFATSLIGNIVVWVTARSILDNIIVVDEEVQGFTTNTGLALGALVIFALLWQGFGWLAINRYMHRAHFQANPSIADSLTHALKRMPTYIRIMLALLLAFVLVILLLSALIVGVPVLGALAIFAALPLGVWVAVKLAFLPSAMAASPPGSPVLRASADVSAGQFWPVLGRVLILSLGLGFAGQILATGLGDLASPIDAEEFSNIFLAEGDQFAIRDFRVTTLLPSTGKLAIVLVMSSLISAASALISTSGYMRLYLDSGAPSEL